MMITDGPDPSGTGCSECEAAAGWWVHLRRCVDCGHIGCCDSSPGQHATEHFVQTGHPTMTSFEPGEDWFWDYSKKTFVDATPLTPPLSRPLDQASPGPAERLPVGWRTMIR